MFKNLRQTNGYQHELCSKNTFKEYNLLRFEILVSLMRQVYSWQNVPLAISELDG